jgi:D-glycero-beta-D-manno-heptose 1-phosphate adenylyltransferase
MRLKKISKKIQSFEQIEKTVRTWQKAGKTVVFTNGCFDLLHYGHLHYLADARDLGDKLIIGLNSAASVKRLKGEHRPINDELTRQHLLAALEIVDAVVVFETDTPLDLICRVAPDILVKGGDWRPEQIIGYEFVLKNGGKVMSLPFVVGYSTTNLEEKIRSW